MNPEEAVAELFEKTVRTVLGSRAQGSQLTKKISAKVGGKGVTSKNFPETVEMLKPLIQRDISSTLKEVILRECRYLLG